MSTHEELIADTRNAVVSARSVTAQGIQVDPREWVDRAELLADALESELANRARFHIAWSGAQERIETARRDALLLAADHLDKAADSGPTGPIRSALEATLAEYGAGLIRVAAGDLRTLAGGEQS